MKKKLSNTNNKRVLKAKKQILEEDDVQFPYNPEHAIGTCAKCGREMTYNVPRLGKDGGYIHKETGQFLCGKC